MDRFKKIIFVVREGVDNSAALKRAADRAKKNNALLTLIEVIRESPIDSVNRFDMMDSFDMMDIPVQVDFSPFEDIQGRIFEERRVQIERLASSLTNEGVSTSTKLLTGIPFIEIIREVIRNKHDLVITVAEGRGELKEKLFGRTSMHLMRKCPCPVWVFKPGYGNKFNRILAAVDPLPYDKVKNELNVKILDLAVSLACLDKAELHFVHAWSTADISASVKKCLSWIDEDKTDHFITRVRRVRQTAIDKLLSKYTLSKTSHSIHIVEGDPVQKILDLAKEEQVELIVMGTLCRVGLAGFFVGNTAEKVLEKADCSVLTVKPDGFVSPVQAD